jgi:branched-chain amino acid transport system substrate-binding protein
MWLQTGAWRRVRAVLALGAAVLAGLPMAVDTAAAADPIRIGLSLSLTGPTSPAGKQVLAGLEIWRDDVNAKGGLLGRPVSLVYYDDQGGPANAPGIYAKLMGVDKVDLLIGPYSTNVIAASLPGIIQAKRTTIGIFGLGANKEFKYPRYFSMNSQGPSPANYSKCVFDLAMEQTPKPTRIALIGADVEYSRNALDGARENAKRLGLEIVFERTYPLSTTEFTPSSAPCRRPTRTWCSAPRCRSTRLASCGRRARSSSGRR